MKIEPATMRPERTEYRREFDLLVLEVTSELLRGPIDRLHLDQAADVIANAAMKLSSPKVRELRGRLAAIAYAVARNLPEFLR